MESYPLGVRRRIIAMYKAGEATEEIAAVFGYSKSGVRRVRQRYEETGSYAPLTGRPGHAPGRRPRLDAPALQRLAAEVARRPDATLAELRGRVGVPGCLATYCQALRRLGLTRKKSRSTRTSGPART
jgi:transposase